MSDNESMFSISINVDDSAILTEVGYPLIASYSVSLTLLVIPAPVYS